MVKVSSHRSSWLFDGAKEKILPSLSSFSLSMIDVLALVGRPASAMPGCYLHAEDLEALLGGILFQMPALCDRRVSLSASCLHKARMGGGKGPAGRSRSFNAIFCAL